MPGTLNLRYTYDQGGQPNTRSFRWTGAGAPANQTIGYTPVAGELLLVTATCRPQDNSGAAPTITITDDGADAWLEVTNGSQASTNHRTVAWWMEATAGMEDERVEIAATHSDTDSTWIIEFWAFNDTAVTAWDEITANCVGDDSGGSNVTTLTLPASGALPGTAAFRFSYGTIRRSASSLELVPNWNLGAVGNALVAASNKWTQAVAWQDDTDLASYAVLVDSNQGSGAQMYGFHLAFGDVGGGPVTREYTATGTVGSVDGSATYTRQAQTREYSSSGTVGSVDGSATYTVAGQVRDYTASGTVGSVDGFATYTVSGQLRDYTAAGTVGQFDGSATYTVSGQVRDYTATGIVGQVDGTAAYTRTPQTREYTSSGTVGQVTGSGTYTVQGADEYTAAGTVGQVQGSATYTRQAQTREYTATGVVGQVDGSATYTRSGAVREYTATGTIGSVDGAATYTQYTPQTREYTAAGQVGAVVGTAAYTRAGPILSGTARILRIDSPTALLAVSAATATLTINKDTTP